MHLLDTTVLIALERSAHNPRHRAALKWLAENQDEELAIPAVVLGEFSEGFEDPEHPTLLYYRTGYQILPIDARVAGAYGSLSRSLRRSGRLIGTNDTWIAATALVHKSPLLTRNPGHFERVPGLNVVEYA